MAEKNEQKLTNGNALLFAAPSVPTLEDALAAMRAREDLTAQKKKRLEEDTRIACQWFGHPADKLVAHPANLNPRFRALSPANLKELRDSRKSAKRGLTNKRVTARDCQGA
jgi:hypothetical protein